MINKTINLFITVGLTLKQLLWYYRGGKLSVKCSAHHHWCMQKGTSLVLEIDTQGKEKKKIGS